MAAGGRPPVIVDRQKRRRPPEGEVEMENGTESMKERGQCAREGRRRCGAVARLGFWPMLRQGGGKSELGRNVTMLAATTTMK